MDGAGLMIREYDKVSDHLFKNCLWYFSGADFGLNDCIIS